MIEYRVESQKDALYRQRTFRVDPDGYARRTITRKRELVVFPGFIGQIKIPLPPKREFHEFSTWHRIGSH